MLEWLKSLLGFDSPSLEQRQEALEAKAKRAEKLAEFAKREAEVRKRIVDANRVIKESRGSRQSRGLVWGVVLVMFVMIVFIFVKGC